MTEKTGSGYENIYPKTLRSLVERSVSNASSLGGESASNYLKKTEGCTLENLSVYINSFSKYAFTRSDITYSSRNNTWCPYNDGSQSLYSGTIGAISGIKGATVGENGGVTISFRCTSEMLYSENTFTYVPTTALGNYVFCAKKGMYSPNNTYLIEINANRASLDNFFRVVYNHNYKLKASGKGWNIYYLDGLSSEGRFSVSYSITSSYTTITSSV